jgi:AAA15 family ATPase/GTPase
MLVQFSVANYKSIKDKITLSMVTDKPKKGDDRLVYPTGFKAAPYLTNIAAIYGPNGSGKSNIVKALDTMRDFINDSFKDKQRGEEIEVTPFLFSKDTKEAPTEFEITFIHADYLFQYGFVADKNSVHEEWLFATPKKGQRQRAQTWLERERQEITVGKEIVGEVQSWKKATRENALFLSTAVAMNADAFAIPFMWIKEFLRIIIPLGLSPAFTVKQIKDTEHHKRISQLLRHMDAAFHDVKVVEREFTELDLPENMPLEIKQEILKDMKGKSITHIFGVHPTDYGEEYHLPFDEESLGTQRLFSLIGPWLDVLDNGYTVIIDELQNSLHPFLVRGLIELFGNSEYNKKNAQLIFTTHDTDAMNYLRRDQVWLMSRGELGASQMESVADFAGRPDEAMEKRYHSGRYGALPNIRFSQ